jgi:cobalt-zinc-cadmium efflux system membrane fusion protein
MTKYFFIPLVFLVAAACNTKNEPVTRTDAPLKINTVELSAEEVKNAGIETGRIEKRPVSSLFKVNGKIDVPPQNMISVSAPLGGYLKFTKLLEGMHVVKGEVIATMEDLQYIQLQQDYLTAKTYLNSIEKDFQRQKELNQNKTSSDKVFENAQSQFIAQKVTVRSLYEKLKLIGINPETLDENNISRSVSITSPINGYVSSVKMNVGKYASPTDVLFELVNPEDIHLALTVFEKDVDKLFIGQKVVAYTNNPDSKKYDCEVILIGKDISRERAVTVHCHFLQYDKTLIPGMYMNADVEISSNNAHVIPNDAIVLFEDKEYVFIQSAVNKYEMEEVTALNSENGFTQIVFPDHKELFDKLFVLKGAYTLLMKMKNTEE